MSTPADIMAEQEALRNTNFTGGIPSTKDLAPSIIFLVLYALTLPILIWRLCRKSDRTTILIRPCIFLTARIGMLVVRAIQAKSDFNLDLMIAELVLVSVGFLFIIEPAIELWRRHIADCLPTHQQPTWVRRAALLLKIGLLAAIGTGVAGASKTSTAFDSPDGASTVQNLRRISYVLSLVVVGVLVIAIVSTHMSFGLDARKTAFNLVIALLLLVVASYRVAQCFSTNPDAAARSDAAFWILMVLFEFFAYAILLTISLPRWYPKPAKTEIEERKKGWWSRNNAETGSTSKDIEMA